MSWHEPWLIQSSSFPPCPFQIVLANPGSEIMKKLDSSKVLELIGHEWIFPTVGEAVSSCDYVLHSHKPGVVMDSAAARESMV
jgi:sulfate transporter 3